LRANPVVKLKGDFDVFGDGSVTILSTPGHTPGHQSLMVRLQRTGVVILSGDMVHFQSNWDNRRVPGFNFNRDQSVESMNRVAAIMVTEKAQLWINHDKAQTQKMLRPPAYYD
jgi:glyoxylase-like metal-dependent hydrolase (beta-lactamase superfamily II)